MSLTEQLFAHLDEARRASLRGLDVESLLSRHLAAAEGAWPGVRVLRAELLAHIASHLPEDAAPALVELHAADLYLALACARGDARALATVEQHLADVAPAVERMKLGGARVEDVMQTLRRVLFVGEQPKIAEYAGRGELRSWLRVTAVRAALKVVRSEAREVATDDDVLAAMPAPAADAELDYVKRQYRAGFKRAFLDALSSLPSREQNLIRQHFLDGLSIDQLGALYRVHRATAARWLQRAQATLFERTKRALIKQMKVSKSECDSIIRMAQSQLHITLRSLAPR
jgi:RNA polymerase sigma-70 factor (ECF subfamily)